MGRPAMRAAVTVVVALGFLSVWASIAFDWPAEQWIAPTAYGLLAIGVAIGLVRLLRRRRRSHVSSSELSGSDDYSDIQLGRRPITHFPRDEASSSQIGDPPQGRQPPL